MKISFYHFVMAYRGKTIPDDKSKLADWIFNDHGFPKQATSYHEISDYLEMNSPFSNALTVFDDLFEAYNLKINPDL
ncbi:YozE family protein [Virgibacillus sp. MSJ-26]|uniref:YozE family protein n=1 Tax=Virgibacillus sp. MSJ-26 TaxID=2841522 RepID=UPI001C11B48B|nr:YozE family protein [Virgibacillus sp. MSJ-26]MBU5466642.1 YozE family protein [Virgibacillus sp. MSJ-26]